MKKKNAMDTRRIAARAICSAVAVALLVLVAGCVVR